MDAFTAQHLDKWARSARGADEYDAVIDRILVFLADYPDLIEKGRTWDEIDAMAERYVADQRAKEASSRATLVCNETAYGSTTRLSFAIKVF
jgi:hypothetical protein